MKQIHEQTLIRNENLAPGVFLLEVEKPNQAEPVLAGQFYNLQTGEGLYPLLRRPISVSQVTENTLQFVVFLKGEGTLLLSRKKPGDKLNLMGPFGNGYTLPEAGGRHLVLAGGIGVAPQQELVKVLAQRQPEQLTALLGFRNAPYGLESYQEACHEVLIATEDGSAGYHGTLASPMQEQLDAGPWDMVYACGPHGMLKAVAAQCNERNIPVQLLMEERMACGIGACLVCACKVKSDETPEGFEHVRTCKEGPVFFGTEVLFHE
jgi:dihydroorotate dehydrogenase electron transfer subunit